MNQNKNICLVIIILSVFANISQAQLANGKAKFFGNILGNYVPSNYNTYWNQVTLQWLGKWSFAQPSQGNFNWTFIDASYNYAKTTHNYKYKQHTFVWGQSVPGWVGSLSASAQQQAVANWMNAYCQRYPLTDFIDVVNEPLHAPPSFASALGGSGTTGWDWVVWCFQTARQKCPNAKLLLNDYDIVNSKQGTNAYLTIINILKNKNLIDGIGIQGHNLQNAGIINIKQNLNLLAATGLPIYVSQLDLSFSNDTQQLQKYKQIVPVLYEHPAVNGITLWGYQQQDIYSGNAQLINSSGTLRPAMIWLQQYFAGTYQQPPSADFTSQQSGSSLTLDASLSYDNDGIISSYAWNFGDSTSGVGKIASHTYTVSGFYSVTLTVTDNSGLTSSISKTVTIGVPLASCRSKFVGSTIKFQTVDPYFDLYWNQVTPQYLGKWTSTEPNQGSWSWTGLDNAYNFAKQKGFPFKQHTFVWGQQIPYWVSGLSTANQATRVQTWISTYCSLHPNTQFIDVVNEPVHITPSYSNSIGGTGTSGWDWVIWSFQKARAHCPNSKLLINDYDILNNAANTNTYLTIINLLKTSNLIDGIGVQAHHLQTTSNSLISSNLALLAATNLPIYVSQLDLIIPDDNAQLARLQSLFPILYEHPSVQGVTFQGYFKGWAASGAQMLSQKTTTLLSNQVLSTSWQNYTIQGSGTIRVSFTNDGQGNSQTMYIDYAIIDGVKYEAEDMLINTAVWNGLHCGGEYSQKMDCPGYIQFPYATQSITIRAKGQNGAQTMSISSVSLQERPSLQWLKNTYFSPASCSTSPISAYFTVQTNNLDATFNGLSSIDTTGTITSWVWNFGDQTTAGTGSIVSHSYALSGTYQVTLTITDSNSHTSTITKPVTIATNSPPIAAFTYTAQGLTVSFDGTGSSDIDGTISSYSWNFNDSQSGTGATKSHTFANPGTYNVTLTVTDNSGTISDISHILTVSQTVSNLPPTAAFTNTINSLSVNVDGSSSSDYDGTISSWSWNFGDGSAAQTGSILSHTYANPGTYTITLTVTDNLGATNTASKSVNLTSTPSNASPVADFTYSASSLLISFYGGSSYDTDGNIVSWSWSFGDGQTSAGTNANHLYAFPGGSFQVTLTVTDNKNAQTSVTKTIQVTDQVPIVSFTYTIGSNNLVSFYSSASDPDGSIASYSWNFGDGQISGGTNANHQYVLPRVYTVKLLVTDNYGGVGTSQQDITIQGGLNVPNIPPVSQFTFSINNYIVLFTSSSYDSDGSISSYLWNFGDGQTSISIGPLTHQYLVAQVYIVQLIVTDNNGATTTSSQSITIGSSGQTNKAPIAAFTYWTQPAIGHFNGGSSYDMDGSISTYAWQFGDGTTGSGLSPNHTYATVGTFTVTLTVTDNQGATATTSKQVYIANPPINVHVQSITSFTTQVGNKLKASATVLILDNRGIPAAGVTVQAQITGTWNYQSINSVTGSNGIATITSSKLKSAPVSFQVCVNNLQPSGGLWYNSTANVVKCA